MSFDHLDDPVGFVSDDEFRAAARRAAANVAEAVA